MASPFTSGTESQFLPCKVRKIIILLKALVNIKQDNKREVINSVGYQITTIYWVLIM